MERNLRCAFDHIAYIDKKPAYILLYSPPDTTGVFDFKKIKVDFTNREDSVIQAGA